jgi:hypothetical protein
MNWININSEKPSLTQKVVILRQWFDSKKTLCTSIEIAYYLNKPNQRHYKCFANAKGVEIEYFEKVNNEWVLNCPLDDSAPVNAILYDNVTHWAELPEIDKLIKIKK